MELNEDASNISQGQKQLLTIARAILADNTHPDSGRGHLLAWIPAPSSSSSRAMDNLMKGRTSFVIAHRLSTIQ